MRKLLAIVCPPLAVFLCAKPITAFFNLLLWCLGVIPGIIHAWSIVNAREADNRIKKQTKAIQRTMRETSQANAAVIANTVAQTRK